METAENPEPEQPVKKDRSRKKQLYQDILKQMEFYFSDSNLAKERFISKKLNENGCVDLSLFLTFNKIRALTSEPKDLVKALRRSELLQVSEDNMTVTRVTPIQKKENEDDYIIYVEQLPPNIDHDWLREVFLKYGKIDYISLPKFKNGKLKGFGFVEFASTESVDAIIKDYKKVGSYLSTEMAPEELCSIHIFGQDMENNENSKQGKHKSSNLNYKREVEEESVVEDNSNNPAEGMSGKIKKRKKLDSDVPLEDENSVVDLPENVKKKKSKRDNLKEEEQDVTVENGKEENEDKSDSGKKKQKKSKMKDDQAGEAMDESNTDQTVNEQPDQKLDGNSGEESEINEQVKKKKNRKNKKKSKKLKITADNSGLQILSKKDWRRLRNKYLNTQKDKMKLLKKHLSQQQFRVDQLTLEQQKENSTGIPTEFTPGLIVKVILPEPVIEVKRFKEEVKASSNVKYIDVKEGATQIYFRFDSAEDAKNFSNNTEFSDQQIIEGEEETRYWQKIQTDRAEKMQKSKKFKERGKTKLIKKAEKALGKHIVFEGLDNE